MLRKIAVEHLQVGDVFHGAGACQSRDPMLYRVIAKRPAKEPAQTTGANCIRTEEGLSSWQFKWARLNRETAYGWRHLWPDGTLICVVEED